MRFLRYYNGFAILQDCGGRGSLGVSGAEVTFMLQRLTREQALGIGRGQPAAVFGDADGHDLVLILINGFENRSGGKKRDFVLATASPEKNPDFQLVGH